MPNCFPEIGRYISILDRLMRMYYDRGLTEFEIGWGQQFYVEYLYDHPGASQQEMVECICVDKATLTKSIKKLVEIGYVRESYDERDRRMKCLYLTPKAIPAAEKIKKIHAAFYETITSGISEKQIDFTEKSLSQMTENLNRKVWHRMMEETYEQ